jgi:hypothetical protein
MPYALVATNDRLSAGLADGQLWGSLNRGDSRVALQRRGETLDALDHARG